MLLANDYFFNNVFDPTFDYVYDVSFRGDNDAKVSATYTTRYFCGEYQQGSFVAKIQNMGADTLTSAHVELLVNGEVIRTKDWTGSLLEMCIRDRVEVFLSPCCWQVFRFVNITPAHSIMKSLV